MSLWKEYKLGDIIDIKHGFAFKGEYFSEVETENLLLTPGNFAIGGGFKGDKLKYYNGEIPEDYILNDGAVIVTMTDLSKEADTLGYSAKVPITNSKVFLHNQRIGLVRIRNNNFDKDYIYWLLRTFNYQRFIAGSATGATVKHTSPTKIYAYKFKAPSSITVQRKIASILSAYDDLIENNLRRIKLLEEVARRTYEEWFVKLKVKSEKLKVDKRTGLPEGWERRTIGDCCLLSGGGTPSRTVPEYWEAGTITWFSPTDLSKSGSIYQMDSADKITEDGLKNSSAKLLQPDSFMISSRATIGLFGIVDRPFSTNQGFINVTPLEGYHKEYLFYNFLSRVDEFKGYATGATFPELSKAKFKVLDMLWPDSRLLREFHHFILPIHQTIANLSRHNQLLKESRDLLLPRLMSGEMEVPD